jgi:hypothetical protein
LYAEYLYNITVKNGEGLNFLDIQKTATRGLIYFADSSQISVTMVLPEYNRLLKINEFRNGLKLAVMNDIGLKTVHSGMTSHLQKLNELIEDDLKNDED